MWTTYIGKRKQKTLTRKDKGKKPKVMDETLLESDEFTPSRMKNAVQLTKSPT
jgi:hypothetical protein